MVRARPRDRQYEARPSRGLEPDATTREVVATLLGLGMHTDDLAVITGCSAATVRNWAQGKVEPRRIAELALDDTRTVVRTLLDAQVEPPRVVKWLRARNGSILDKQRPIDLIGQDPLMVLAAAEELILTTGRGLAPAAPSDAGESDGDSRRRRSRRGQALTPVG